MKHAGQARTTVRLDYRPRDLLVTVSDDGSPGESAPAAAGSRAGPRGQAEPVSGGRGLIGLRERITVYGGDDKVLDFTYIDDCVDGTPDRAPAAGGGWRPGSRSNRRSRPGSRSDRRPWPGSRSDCLPRSCLFRRRSRGAWT